MHAKRLFLSSLLAGLILCGAVVLGVSSAEFVTSACSCVTVNMDVTMRLNRLDALVQSYASTHDGLAPTYDELERMTIEDRWVVRHLSPKVDISTRAFTFTPSKSDANKTGYAVSVDRRSYVLIGIGLNEKQIDRFLFGRWIRRELVGFEFPVLRPSDIPPEPSPPA